MSANIQNRPSRHGATAESSTTGGRATMTGAISVSVNASTCGTANASEKENVSASESMSGGIGTELSETGRNALANTVGRHQEPQRLGTAAVLGRRRVIEAPGKCLLSVLRTRKSG